jgi:hypothetical protein
MINATKCGTEASRRLFEETFIDANWGAPINTMFWRRAV